MGSVDVADTLSFLLGTWSLERSLEDHRWARTGSFSGNAVMTATRADGASGLVERAHYCETGELRFGTHIGPSSRQLEYRRLGRGAAMVHFAGGRPFIQLDLRPGTCRRIHRCGEDRYEITTHVRSESLVQELWRVRGPAKDYAATATLIRLA